MSPTIVWYQGDEKLQVEFKEIIFEINIFCLKFLFLEFKIISGQILVILQARTEIMGRILVTLLMPKKVGPGPYFSHLGPGHILAIAYFILWQVYDFNMVMLTSIDVNMTFDVMLLILILIDVNRRLKLSVLYKKVSNLKGFFKAFLDDDSHDYRNVDSS